ncbi:hypothetical protein B296_00043620 [Ensete ventricosum]|uniref:Cytochrome P450 n=1 Tax=Ensete ventricosum TaxID=4639 RepID=A0A426XCG4_ENSVE|nr:hypothetical protein B296_00043620 [Ensete ventricosum]
MDVVLVPECHWGLHVHGTEGVGLLVVEAEEGGGALREAGDQGSPLPLLRWLCQRHGWPDAGGLLQANDASDLPQHPPKSPLLLSPLEEDLWYMTPSTSLPLILPFVSFCLGFPLNGSTFLLWFGPTARLAVADPSLIREILLSRSDVFERYESHPLVRQLEGEGLVSLTGEKWAHHRKVLTPTFHMENLKVSLVSYLGFWICTS